MSAPATTTGPVVLSQRDRMTRRWKHRARLVEAAVLLTAAGAAQKWVAMPSWSKVLGDHGDVPPAWRGQRIERLPQRADSRLERVVAIAVHRAAARLPWKPTCLAEATAGQMMLRRRGRSGVVVIGLCPDMATDDGRWGAHAWLLGRAGCLTGGPAARGFTATTVFEAPAGIRSTDVDLSHTRG